MIRRIVTALAMLAAVAPGAPAKADVADFYAGKTVTIMVPSGLGASLGIYARMLSARMGEHIPGKPSIILSERAGGGGVNGTLWAFNVAPRDGSLIAAILAPSVLAPVLHNAKFDATKFQWIGAITPNPATVAVWHTAPVKTVAEAQKTEITVGATQFGSETYITPQLMNALLGTKFKIVKGYKAGAELNKAMEQGEIQGRMSYWSGWLAVRPDWVRDGKIVQLLQYGPPIKKLPNVPRFRDLVQDLEGKKMVQFLEVANSVGIAYWVHPDVPADRIAALHAAFMATMKDPAFLSDAAKARAEVDPVSAEDLHRTVAEGLDVSPALITHMKKALNFK